MANELKTTLVVCFGLTDGFPEANLRHYQLMLEGLQDVSKNLAKRGIEFVLQNGTPSEVALRIGRDACAIVCDRGYLRIQREWRDDVASQASYAVFQIESDVVVPVEVVSLKAEYAARTIRPKIHKYLKQFLKPVQSQKLERASLGHIKLKKENLDDLGTLLKTRFTDYLENRNHPARDAVSHLGMYLHFGQVPALEIVLEVLKMPNA